MESDRRDRKRGNDSGSSMIYVILIITLLAIFSCGYMSISRFNMESTLNSRRYMEAHLTAKTIHRTFCESVGRGESEVMDCIWQSFEADCDMVFEEYDEMIAEEEETGEDAADKDERWERYLKHALGDKEYVMKGTGSHLDGEGVTVDITVKAKPLSKFVNVSTKVVCSGYTFSMKADIVFDHSDGAVITGENSYQRSGRGREVYLEGNGIYRYYEDGDE